MLLTGTLFFALKPQLFKFSYNNPPKAKSKTYRYPIDVQTYAVPDQVFVRTVAKTTTESYVFKSSSEKRITLDGKLNLKASTRQLSGELDFSINFLDEGISNQSIVMNFAETSLYQLYLGNRILRQEITEAMQELRGTFRLDPTTYNLFLAKYGTHFVDSIVIGGSVIQETRVRFNSQTEQLRIAASLKGRFESASGGPSRESTPTAGGNSSSGGGGGGATTVEGSLDLFYNDIELKVSTETTSNSEIYGGDPSFTDFVLTAGDSEATRTLFESWKSTLMTNPIGIRYRLVEIWTLLDDPLQQKELCNALATLLGFLPDEDPKYCDVANRLLGGTIRQGLGGSGGR